MDTKYAFIGFVRGLGVVLLTAGLSYLGVAEHLNFLNPTVATLISAIALGLENAIESNTGKALFGAVRV
jgi:hypothetical protein